jgi:tRNA pseudouridine55 synthase
MARRRKGQPVHGWIAIDKAAGMTSTQVVGAVRRILDAQKAGHGGTLDPLATGVLPVALGEATKTVPYVMDGAKTYGFTIHFGEERTTDDKEGAVSATSAVRPTAAGIVAALAAFRGRIEQIPPRYSAVKVDGKRAYAMARDGAEVVLEARTIRIDAFDLVAASAPDGPLDWARFRVRSGKGAYMRSLARDLARAVGTVGHIGDLRRLACGPFDEASAISLDKLSQLGHSARDFLLPVETALDDIPALALTDAEARRLTSGQSLSLPRLTDHSPAEAHCEGDTLRAMAGGKLVAITRIEGGDIRPVRVLNL